jgi:Fic family protein
VQNYRTAMSDAVGWIGKSGITLEVICRIHRQLLEGVRGHGMTPGKIRSTQNFIGHHGQPMEKAIYIPPTPADLHPALEAFEAYLGVAQRDIIVQTAMAHAQFELLHPFLDGNGRVGRILIPLLLHEKGLISSPTFYISEYFEENRRAYYDRLGALSEKNDWQGWVEFFLTAVVEQAERNTRRAADILKLYNSMKDEINAVTRSQYAIETLDALFESPFLTKADFVKRTGVALRSAERLLPELEAAGILRVFEQGAGRRPTVYSFHRLIAITEGKGAA